MIKFIKEINTRDGQSSSKKFWYNVACLTATIVLLWVTYKDNMEDWAYIIFYLIYLLTVGGFEVVLQMMRLVIQFKEGKNASPVNDAPSSPAPSGN